MKLYDYLYDSNYSIIIDIDIDIGYYRNPLAMRTEANGNNKKKILNGKKLTVAP